MYLLGEEIYCCLDNQPLSYMNHKGWRNRPRILCLKTGPEAGRMSLWCVQQLVFWLREHKEVFLPWLFTKASLCWLMKRARAGEFSRVVPFLKWHLDSTTNGQIPVGSLSVTCIQLLRLSPRKTKCSDRKDSRVTYLIMSQQVISLTVIGIKGWYNRRTKLHGRTGDKNP